MRVAGIGTRAPDDHDREVCFKLGRWVAQCGHILDTGLADGIDQAFGAGVNSVNPELLHLHLPWPKFNREAIVEGNHVHLLEDLTKEQYRLYQELAQQYHPAWSRLSQGARKLMVRNSSILLPPPDCWPVDLCLALPSDKPGGGGTGQGMRIAAADHTHTRLVDLRGLSNALLWKLCEEIKETA